MYNEFCNLLDQNHINHISKMFNLLNRVPSTLTPLSKLFSQYIETQGLKAVENLQQNLQQQQQQQQQQQSSATAKPITIDPKLYIKTLIQVYHNFQKIVAEAFQDHPIFVKALDNACRAYINFNTIAKNNNSKSSSTASSSKTPDLLAKYSDNLLKKSKDADATSDMSVDDIMIIFKFLTDKDAFETHYRRLLAKRLIHGTSSSEEAEETIIQRLQTENSLEYTSKITKMFQDIRASHELEILFKEETLKNHEGIIPDFEPFILTETMWPFNYSKNSFQLPMDLMPSFNKLEEIYSTKHNGRILKWHWSLNRGEIKANLQKPFTFSMTLYQMSIILPFNEIDSYTVGELLELTGLDQSTFQNSITPMIKYKLLIPSSSKLDDRATKLTIVSEFKSKRLKINFAAGARTTDTKQDQIDAEKEINEDRKNYLKACIVRIMKARKLLQHNLLINEVVQQSHQRFSAKIADIKKCIDELVDQEYLRRNEDQTYDYLA
jgi:cullin 1